MFQSDFYQNEGSEGALPHHFSIGRCSEADLSEAAPPPRVLQWATIRDLAFQSDFLPHLPIRQQGVNRNNSSKVDAVEDYLPGTYIVREQARTPAPRSPEKPAQLRPAREAPLVSSLAGPCRGTGG